MIRRGIRPNNDRVGTRTRVSRRTDASPGPPLNSRTNRRKLCGFTDTLWTPDELYDAVMKQQAEKKQHERIAKLLKKVRSL